MRMIAQYCIFNQEKIRIKGQLQADINSLAELYAEWSIDPNIEKYEIMYFRRKNQKLDYYISMKKVI